METFGWFLYTADFNHCAIIIYFQEIRNQSQECSYKVAKFPENQSRNRYRDVSPCKWLKIFTKYVDLVHTMWHLEHVCFSMGHACANHITYTLTSHFIKNHLRLHIYVIIQSCGSKNKMIHIQVQNFNYIYKSSECGKCFVSGYDYSILKIVVSWKWHEWFMLSEILQ